MTKKKPAAQTDLFPGKTPPTSGPKVSAVAAVPIEIVGQIGWDVDAKEIRSQITAADPKAEIAVSLHSPGGSIFDGYLIHNSLRDHPGPVSVKIMGLAASAGSWIPLAADPGQIRMHKLAQLMIHKGRGGAFDTADGLERHAALLRTLDDQMAALYAARTGLESDAILDMMDAETYMTTEEALEAGFVDEIVEGSLPENRLDLSSLADVPEAVAQLFGVIAAPPAEPDPIMALLVGGQVQDLRPEEIQPIEPDVLALVGAAILEAQGADA